MNTKTIYGNKYIYRNIKNPSQKKETSEPFNAEELKTWKQVGMSSNRMVGGQKILTK